MANSYDEETVIYKAGVLIRLQVWSSNESPLGEKTTKHGTVIAP
jgi:hypothetical protein